MGQLTRNEVFTLAVQRYSDTVYRTAVHNCRCTADAEDVVSCPIVINSPWMPGSGLLDGMFVVLTGTFT